MDNLDQQSEALKKALIVLDKVFNNNFPYRVIGSTVIAAINKKPHRTINDIDIVIDKNNFDKVLELIKKEGYIIEQRHILGLKFTEAKDSQRVGFTFLLVGNFTDKYFSCNIYPQVELRVSNDYIIPTTYNLYGINITGIPLNSIRESLKISNLNPKRTLDKQILQKAIGSKQLQGESLGQAFKVFIFGIEIPHLYTIFSYLYNLYGGLRVLLGKKYEVW